MLASRFLEGRSVSIYSYAMEHHHQHIGTDGKVSESIASQGTFTNKNMDLYV